ncbi:uncharacterized protein SPSC_01724 [Sporisorium scitamineum]|uniref:Uncharacterized protein n=1 Tax=Sporisorium scitamineum TaxID=49012 RepID=A0A0F7S7D6_9BASI|nr:uncharacterized protein SPSC_01724 [Sporisorium scitamineum]CDW96583.1 hypothetical protein [Sporisorium scitamineum]
MFATTEDLIVSVRTDDRRRGYSDSCKSRGASDKKSANRKTKTARTTPASDSADEIQVIKEQPTAIPIRAGLDRRHSNRHSDLEIGSVYGGKRKPSPLFERRKRDDLDLLADFSHSSDDEATRRPSRDQFARGRERHTKPLLHPKQTSFAHVAPRYDYGVSGKGKDPYSPQLGHHSSRDCSPHGRLPLMELEDEIKGRNASNATRKSGHKHEPLTPRKPPPHALPGLEHEAMVFDNFEDGSSVSSASEQEQDTQASFVAHLHFVRPAMSICANPGAFVALEPIVTPAVSPNELLQDGDKAKDSEAQHKRNRLGHYRAASELFTIPTMGVKATDVRATRRRATVGSEAAYRLPTLHRRQSHLSK